MSKNIQNFTKVISYPPENHSENINKYALYKLPYMAFFNQGLCVDQKKYFRTISNDICLKGLIPLNLLLTDILGSSTKYPKFRMVLVMEHYSQVSTAYYIKILPK